MTLEVSPAELAALRWLSGYRHGTVTPHALSVYYREHGTARSHAQAAGRMWRKLVAKLLIDPERCALTPAAMKAAGA
jgi:hypothetical protein